MKQMFKRISLLALAVLTSAIFAGTTVMAAPPKQNTGLQKAEAIIHHMKDFSVLEEEQSVEDLLKGDLDLSESAVYSRMIALKSQYPEGMTWTNANYYTWKAGIYSIGYGCAGFAFILSDAAFGSGSNLPARVYLGQGGNVQNGPYKKDYSMIRVGDILRTTNDSHSVVVLEVKPTYVVVAEGNYGGTIHWGRIITKKALEEGELTYIMTRYPNDAGTHTHVYKITARTDNTVTMTCDCGKQVVITGPTSYSVFMENANKKTYLLSKQQEKNITVSKNVATPIIFSVDSSCTDNMVFSSSDTSIATIKEYSLGEGYDNYYMISVTGKKAGTCNITVKSQYVGKTVATLQIKVLCSGDDHIVAIKTTQKVDGNCVTPGKEYQVTYCKNCGQEFGGAWVNTKVNPNIHTGNKKTINAKAATQNEPGYTGDICCKDCGVVLSKGKRIEPLSNPFADVSMTHWAYEHVLFVYNKKIMVGSGKNSAGKIIFKPDATVTRAEFVQALYNMDGSKEVVKGTSNFTDVRASDWYCKAVMWAYKHGVVSGKSKTNFGAKDNITRQEVATVMYNYVTKYKKMTNVKLGKLDGFSDKNSVDKWAIDALKWATQYKIINGKPINNNTKMILDPKSNATRAEAATIIRQFTEAVKNMK